MNRKINLLTLGCFLSFIVGGCAVRTYPVIKERVDQELTTGNRGYLMGVPEVSEEKARKTTRQLQTIEVEFRPITFGKPAASISESELRPDISAEGVSPASTPEIKSVITQPAESRVMVMKKYTVRKGDTLGCISKKFYGTTKRWREIYEANRGVLKSPHKLYPGKVIEIPVEEAAGIK